jgi:hypothetical protein
MLSDGMYPPVVQTVAFPNMVSGVTKAEFKR